MSTAITVSTENRLTDISVGSLLSFGPNVAQATAAANRILSFRVREDAIRTGTLDLEDTSGGVKIELKDVFFKYPTRDIPIFAGINLTVSNITQLLGSC